MLKQGPGGPKGEDAGPGGQGTQGVRVSSHFPAVMEVLEFMGVYLFLHHYRKMVENVLATL